LPAGANRRTSPFAPADVVGPPMYGPANEGVPR
jgi:hypothetical protein